MSAGLWLSLFTICLLGAMSPGPSLATVVSNTLSKGRSAGLVTGLAHGLGVALYGLLTVAGLAAVISGTPTLFKLLQLAGAAYLVWLGVRPLLWAAAGTLHGEQRHGSPALDGFLVAFLNPKLAIFMLALFSQFLQADAGWQHKAIMVATVGCTDAAWYCLMALLVSHARVLEKLRRANVVIDRVFGLILIALALSVTYRALA
jgi:threonine/homoserine/homoserine lactone efflux protein